MSLEEFIVRIMTVADLTERESAERNTIIIYRTSTKTKQYALSKNIKLKKTQRMES